MSAGGTVAPSPPLSSPPRPLPVGFDDKRAFLLGWKNTDTHNVEAAEETEDGNEQAAEDACDGDVGQHRHDDVAKGVQGQRHGANGQKELEERVGVVSEANLSHTHDRNPDSES